MDMFRKRIPAAFLLWVFILAMMWTCSGRPGEVSDTDNAAEPKVPAREITIRNVTDETVVYTIKAIYVPGDPEEKELAVQHIDRYHSNVGMDVSFKHKETWVRYRLDPGQPYSFRYDEDNNLELYEGSHGRDDAIDLAPFVPTPMEIVEKMLEMAWVTKNDLVYDLGCGDGRIVISAARKYGARGVGIDLDEELVETARNDARASEIDHLVEFRTGDATKANISEATVVTLYLLTESNELLRPLFDQQLKAGTRIVSHNYKIPGWEHKEINYEVFNTEDGKEHSIYLYRK
jgi:SAM-dependent methyltransferase